MTEIALQFRRGRGLTSKAIAWWGNGWHGWSHVDARLPDGLLGARWDNVGGGPGVRLRPFDYEASDVEEQLLLALEVTPTQAAAWEKGLRAQVGEDYDPDDILSLFLGTPVHVAEGHWICSALQTNELQAIGVLPPLGVPPQQVTPDSLAIAIRAAGGLPRALEPVRAAA